MEEIKESPVRKPTFCVLQLSSRCMFRCKMCHCWEAEENGNELTIEEGKNFVLALKELVDGPLEINIGGGEPLMKKDILSLVKFVIKNNFSVTMTSNGFLIEEEMAKDIADSGVVSMPISLDSLDPRIHDFLRGQDGAHKNAMKAIEYFLKYQGSMHHITIQTIIMDVNLDGILALTHWAKERNISISFMGIMNPNPGFADERWYESAPYSFLWPKDIAKVHLIVDQLIRLKKEGLRITNSFAQLEAFKLYFENPLRFVRKSICSLGDGIVNVDPKGDVYLCWQMKPIGNIKTHRLKDIWYSEIAKRIRNDIFFCKKNCAEMINCFFED